MVVSTDPSCAQLRIGVTERGGRSGKVDNSISVCVGHQEVGVVEWLEAEVQPHVHYRHITYLNPLAAPVA